MASWNGAPRRLAAGFAMPIWASPNSVPVWGFSRHVKARDTLLVTFVYCETGGTTAKAAVIRRLWFIGTVIRLLAVTHPFVSPLQATKYQFGRAVAAARESFDSRRPAVHDE